MKVTFHSTLLRFFMSMPITRIPNTNVGEVQLNVANGKFACMPEKINAPASGIKAAPPSRQVARLNNDSPSFIQEQLEMNSYNKDKFLKAMESKTLPRIASIDEWV